VKEILKKAVYSTYTQAIQADPLKKALIQIQAVFSELEKNQIVRRLKKGRERAKAKRGKCEGRKPFGETPEEALIVKKIKSMRRKRKGRIPGLTLQEIAEKLNSDGIQTKSGKDWTANHVWNVLNKKTKRLK